MGKNAASNTLNDPIDRVDARTKVTGTATYAAEHKIDKTVYGFLVGSTIAKGRSSIGSRFNLKANSSMADSSAKHPVASPGPRIHIGVQRFSGTRRYRVFTFGHA